MGTAISDGHHHWTSVGYVGVRCPTSNKQGTLTLRLSITPLGCNYLPAAVARLARDARHISYVITPVQ